MRNSSIMFIPMFISTICIENWESSPHCCLSAKNKWKTWNHLPLANHTFYPIWSRLDVVRFRLGKKTTTSGTWGFWSVYVETSLPMYKWIAPPKTNMEPKNRWLVDVSPFPGVFFRFHVCFQGCILRINLLQKKHRNFFWWETSHPENLFPFPSILVPNPLQTRSPTCSGT